MLTKAKLFLAQWWWIIVLILAAAVGAQTLRLHAEQRRRRIAESKRDAAQAIADAGSARTEKDRVLDQEERETHTDTASDVSDLRIERDEVVEDIASVESEVRHTAAEKGASEAFNDAFGLGDE